MRLITSGALICMCMQEVEGDLLCMFAHACFKILSSESSRCPLQQRNLNVYATAHLSGDVANAVTLLKRMTRPSSRKHKAGLLIPSTDIAACQVRMSFLCWRVWLIEHGILARLNKGALRGANITQTSLPCCFTEC